MKDSAGQLSVVGCGSYKNHCAHAISQIGIIHLQTKRLTLIVG
jgi:hypothetical protein